MSWVEQDGDLVPLNLILRGYLRRSLLSVQLSLKLRQMAPSALILARYCCYQEDRPVKTRGCADVQETHLQEAYGGGEMDDGESRSWWSLARDAFADFLISAV